MGRRQGRSPKKITREGELLEEGERYLGNCHLQGNQKAVTGGD